jgi:hypothetical protein
MSFTGTITVNALLGRAMRSFLQILGFVSVNLCAAVVMRQWAGASHLSLGQIPGADTDRRVQIGGITFDIPVLDLDHIKQISSLPLPTPGMNPVDAIDAKLRIAYAILSPFYAEATIEFLEENLTIPDADMLWRLAFPSAD